MDATQKKKMWKVAAIHFALSVVVAWKFFGYVLHEGDFRSLEPDYSFYGIWLNTWRGLFFSLQPIWWTLMEYPGRIILGCYFIFIPIWSICFGWIFVRLDNWLNHFPVLGKRVF